MFFCSCSICSKDILVNDLSRCSNNHMYHYECLNACKDVKEYTPICIACFKEPLRELKNVEKCLVCSIPLRPGRCRFEGNVCNKCIEVWTFPDYIKLCRGCNNYHLEYDVKCIKCNQIVRENSKQHRCIYDYCDTCKEFLGIIIPCHYCIDELDISKIFPYNKCTECLRGDNFNICNYHRYFKDLIAFENQEICYSKISKKCSKCFKNLDLVEFVCANKHLYCRDCFVTIPTDYYSSNCCKSLDQYFKCMLCYKFLEKNDYNCQANHKLCKSCFSDAQKREYLKNNCRSCSVNFDNENRLSIGKPNQNICVNCKGIANPIVFRCSNDHIYCTSCLATSLFEKSIAYNCSPCIEKNSELYSLQNHNPLVPDRKIFSRCEYCQNIVTDVFCSCINSHQFCNDCIKVFGIAIMKDQDCGECKNYAILYENAHPKLVLDPQISQNPEIDDREIRNKCYLCQEFFGFFSFTCQNNHNYCEGCVQKHGIYSIKSFDCRECRNYADYEQGVQNEKLIKEISIQGYQCVNCAQKITDFEFCCENNHTYCRTCIQDHGTQVLRYLNCEKCIIKAEYLDKSNRESSKISFDHSGNVKNQTLSHIITKNRFDLSMACKKCSNSSEVAFSCNHNICYKCILNKVNNTFTKFLKHYKAGKINKILPKVCHKCPVDSCKQQIKPPAELLLSKLNNFFGQDDLKILKIFLPYFEGLKFKFIICDCNRVVGIVFRVRVNCYCGNS